jgi:hypothetical protein
MIAAVIPTRYHPPQLDELLRVLEADEVTVYQMDSPDYEHHIYAMWNAGVRLARAAGATEIAVLNDDIEIPEGGLPALAGGLRSADDIAVTYPDVNATKLRPGTPQATVGTWGSGGMTGFCFMFRADLPLPSFDERYGWWYGDDVFEAQVREMGYRVCRVPGVPIIHTANGSASRRWAELAPLIAADRARWEARQ